jgi:hypothetical protein
MLLFCLSAANVSAAVTVAGAGPALQQHLKRLQGPINRNHMDDICLDQDVAVMQL